MSATISGKIPLAQARTLALELVELFGPVCTRIEIAGSVRREKAEVGDIEIVMVPKIEDVEDPGDLFGQKVPRNLQFATCLQLVYNFDLQHRNDKNGHCACGERYQRMIYKGVALDLFCVLPPASWGVLFALRTGPDELNKRLVTQRAKGGLLPDDMKIQDGQLWVTHNPGDRNWKGEVVETPEESDFFEEIGVPMLDPRDRK